MFGLFGPPSRQKFAKIVMDAARKAGVHESLEFDETDFSVKAGAGRAYLGNVYDHYCHANRHQKQRILANFVSIMQRQASELTREMALEQCVAAVRERALFSFMALRGQVGAQPAEIAYQPISEWFVKTVVIDSPESMAMVTQDDLKRWELTFDELYKTGLERLRASTQPKFQAIDGFFQGTWNDDYDASRILLPELSKSLPIDEPVFCLPNRLKLLVTDAANTKALEAMLKRAEWICQNEPRPSNPAPLTIRNGHVEDFTVPDDSPLFDSVQRARGITALMYYQEEAELLNQIHQQTGEAIFVAKYSLNQNEAGRYVSICVWSKDVISLLPKTDVIMFFDPDKPEQNQVVAEAKFDDVQRICGDLMLDTEIPTEVLRVEVPDRGSATGDA